MELRLPHTVMSSVSETSPGEAGICSPEPVYRFAGDIAPLRVAASQARNDTSRGPNLPPDAQNDGQRTIHTMASP